MGEFHVAVIGAGISGMQFTRDLQRDGISHTVYERGPEVGGTWRENRYPGLYIDVPVVAYQMSFERKYDWSNPFAAGPEIQDYLLAVADKHDLRKHVRFNTEVLDASWINDQWHLTLSDGTVDRADALICATGFLDKPQTPTIDGMDTFKGDLIHTARWPEAVNLSGKRIGVVGSGASGIQVTATLGMEGHDVKQFVRTPQWVEIITNPKAPWWRRKLAGLLGPRFPKLGEKLLMQLAMTSERDATLANPDITWRTTPGPRRVEAQDALRRTVDLIDDPALRARMTPTFEPGCKRIPKSDDYYAAIGRDNVEVVFGGVDRIDETGVWSTDGEHHEVDVIVFATGYDPHAYMRPMTMRGVDGVSIDDAWADGVFAYRTTSVPKFPNMWIIQGPYAPVANVSPTMSAVTLSTYVRGLLQVSIERNVWTAPTEEATKRFLAWMDAGQPNTIYAGDCSNWYRDGDRIILWPYDDAEFHGMFDDIGLDDLEVVPTRGPVA